jgi:parvulin-like peptidyl-prolyl isomerase
MTDRDLAPVIGPVALTLGQGEVGGPAAGPNGFYVVRVLARELPDAADFDKARADIERELLAQKRNQLWQAWLQTLRAGATVDINRTLLPEP